jgi:hypothetical protein
MVHDASLVHAMAACAPYGLELSRPQRGINSVQRSAKHAVDATMEKRGQVHLKGSEPDPVSSE